MGLLRKTMSRMFVHSPQEAQAPTAKGPAQLVVSVEVLALPKMKHAVFAKKPTVRVSARLQTNEKIPKTEWVLSNELKHKDVSVTLALAGCPTDEIALRVHGSGESVIGSVHVAVGSLQTTDPLNLKLSSTDLKTFNKLDKNSTTVRLTTRLLAMPHSVVHAA